MISLKDLKAGTILRYKTEQVDYYGIVVEPTYQYSVTDTVIRWINHNTFLIHEEQTYNLNHKDHGKNWSIITEET